MENQEMLDIYNNVSQEEHDEYEEMYELLADHNGELRRALSYFILNTYLLENKLIFYKTLICKEEK